MQQKSIKNKGSTARQAFQAIKGVGGTFDFAMPDRCNEEAPRAINVYTDGSLTSSKAPEYGLLGAGAWWPGRNLEQKPLTIAEDNYAYEQVSSKGVKLYTYLGGFGGSSTR